MQCTITVASVQNMLGVPVRNLQTAFCTILGLEEGLSSMVKGETAVISCPTEYATNGTLLPCPPDQPDRVEFELHLLNLVQV